MKVWVIEEHTPGGMNILDTAYSDERVCNEYCSSLFCEHTTYYVKEIEGDYLRSVDGNKIVIGMTAYYLNVEDLVAYTFRRIWSKLSNSEKDVILKYVKVDHPNSLNERVRTEPVKIKIDKIVDRFLSWKLPNDFAPDGGIAFNRRYNGYKDGVFTTDIKRTPEDPSWPVGTNLLTADQARCMIEYILAEVDTE